MLLKFRYGGKQGEQYRLQVSNNMLAVRSEDDRLPFGGTSSATPGAAGVAALVLSKNPQLRYSEVKDILKRCCDRIDAGRHQYDGNGHSRKYGFGRLNAKRAVDLA
jgi:subtilisin family serine protease